MDDIELIRSLSTHPRFTVFEAYAKKLGFQVVLKQCAFTTITEVEFFVRSALIKTRDKVYSQPLLSIFASAENSKQSFINFVWRRGEVLDIEVENDQESQFPSGKNGLEKRQTVFTDLDTGVSVKRVRCLTLEKEVICRVFKKGHVLNMNCAFKEALVQARCNHPNICSFLDFRMYQGKKHSHCAYIVTEWLEQDLATEMQKRVSGAHLYEEIELMDILKDVTAGLLHAKSQGLAHSDIKPSSIVRGPQGLKLAGFGTAWYEEQRSATSTAEGTEKYISPEAWEAMGNPEAQQRSFGSDVFSLGMTILHLAARELLERTLVRSCSELQAMLQRKVQTLKYSEELKRLLAAMLSTVPSDRPTLETVQIDAERIYRQEAQRLTLEALRLGQQAISNIAEGKNAKAIELAAAAHAIYYLLHEYKDTASNLSVWGYALNNMGRSAEAVEKHAAAHFIYSRLPKDKSTAINLSSWGYALYVIGRKAEAVKRHAAAHVIYSRLPEDKSTADNLRNWGCALCGMGRRAEAVEKYSAAHAIYSRLSEDKDAVGNLSSWRYLLSVMGRSAEVIEKYAAATYFPEDKSTADNLNNWGMALRMMGRIAEVVEKFAAAHTIYSQFPEGKDIAVNLCDWGNVLSVMGRSAEAVEKFAAAHAIYSRLPEDTAAAHNLNNWAVALRMMGRSAEAMEKHEAARTIYVLRQLDFDVRACDVAIARLA